MMNTITTILVFAGAIGSGLLGGLYFAFSNFIMRAFDQRPPAQAVAAMNAINVTVINPLFFTFFFGTAIVSIALIVVAASQWDATARFLLAGALLYLVASFGSTMIFNVPLNNRLAGVSIDAADIDAQWRAYCTAWTNWNHVRTVGSLLSSASFTAAAYAR